MRRYKNVDETGIIIFLLAAVAVVAVVAAVLVVRLHRRPDDYGELSELYEELQADHTVLQAEKAAVEDAALGYLAELRTVRAENAVLADEIIKARESLKNEGLSGNSEPVNFADFFDLPTNKFACEPYLVERGGSMVSAFDKNSDQACLQEDCATDPETGIRYYYDGSGTHYMCVALGHAFGVEIGTAYEVTLRNGYVFPVVLADFRHPVDPDHPLYKVLGVDAADDYGDRYEIIDNGDGTYRLGEALQNYDGENVLAVLEFVVDLRIIPHSVREAGTMTALEKFGGLTGSGGNITKMTKIGRVWSR